MLHCCKAHAKLNRKMGNSTPCKILTPENIILKLCIRDYVSEMTTVQILVSFSAVGASPQIGRAAGPIIKLYGSNDVFPPKDGPFGG